MNFFLSRFKPTFIRSILVRHRFNRTTTRFPDEKDEKATDQFDEDDDDPFADDERPDARGGQYQGSGQFDRQPKYGYQRNNQNYRDYNQSYQRNNDYQQPRNQYQNNRFNNYNNNNNYRNNYQNNYPRSSYTYDRNDQGSNTYQRNYRPPNSYNDGYNQDTRRQFNNQSPSYNDQKYYQPNYYKNFENRMSDRRNEIGRNSNTSDTVFDELTGRTFTSIPFNVNVQNKFDVINRVVNPMALMPYESQLTRKFNSCQIFMQEFGRILRQINSPVILDPKGMPCSLDYPKSSPATLKYRNKDEFTIWPGIDGNKKTVGFLVGEPRKHHNAVCVEPTELVVVKDTHKAIASKFQDYLREISQLDVCTNFNEGGNWRRLVVRSNEIGDHMIIPILHPQLLEEEVLENEKQKLKDYFEPLQEELNIKSFYFQACPGVRCSHEKAPFQLIFGDERITENMEGINFALSPETFFPVNKGSAQVLYNTLLEEISPRPDLTILDFSCGPGTFAISIAPKVKRVIGIDISKVAVSDAQKNANLNNIKNATFINGQVEEELPKLMDEIYDEEIIAITSPGKKGLVPAVISLIRDFKGIKKVIYVSSKPEGSPKKNFVHLCAPQQDKRNISGTPFIPVSATAVDMLPHTNKYELVLSFERFM